MLNGILKLTPKVGQCESTQWLNPHCSCSVYIGVLTSCMATPSVWCTGYFNIPFLVLSWLLWAWFVLWRQLHLSVCTSWMKYLHRKKLLSFTCTSLSWPKILRRGGDCMLVNLGLCSHRNSLPASPIWLEYWGGLCPPPNIHRGYFKPPMPDYYTGMASYISGTFIPTCRPLLNYSLWLIVPSTPPWKWE